MAEAAQVAGNVFGGVAGYETGKYNRKVAQANAIGAERDGTVQEARIRDAARQQMGQQAAAQAGNGFQPGTGSALEALMQSQVNATLDALTARRSAASRAAALRSQGELAYAAGKNQLVTGLLGAASSAAGSASDWASARAGQSAPTSDRAIYNASPALQGRL